MCIKEEIGYNKKFIVKTSLKKMKIGILTFHSADNYGAVLQAYGLQEYLLSLGHEVYIIDYKPKYLIAPYRAFVNKTPKGGIYIKLKYTFRNILIAPIRLKRNIAFRKFRKAFLNCINFDFNNVENDFDIFIFGSDQIWNPHITNGFDKIFVGDFPAIRGKKAISYAASAGCVANINDILDKKYIQKQLLNFHAVGVREESLLNALVPTPCSLTIDPVLLAGKDVFLKIANHHINGRYLLLFQLFHDYKVEDIALNIAKEKGLPVVKINSSSESLKDKGIISNASPELFLSYLKNASYVVTSSFHGVAFSILFEKNFTSVCLNPSSGERVYNMLQQLGLQNRIVTQKEQAYKTDDIDYHAVNQLYEIFRDKSKRFIHTAIND